MRIVIRKLKSIHDENILEFKVYVFLVINKKHIFRLYYLNIEKRIINFEPVFSSDTLGFSFKKAVRSDDIRDLLYFYSFHRNDEILSIKTGAICTKEYMKKALGENNGAGSFANDEFDYLLELYLKNNVEKIINGRYEKIDVKKKEI